MTTEEEDEIHTLLDSFDKKENSERKNTKKSEEDLNLEYALLRVLGFDEYDDRADGKGLKYKLKLPTSILDEPAQYPKIWITRKYNDKFPNGHFSAVHLDEDGKVVEHEGKPVFLKKEDCMKLPPIANFYECREVGYVPPETVIGKLVSVKGKSRCIELYGGQGEVTGLRISYPASLIKKNKDGDYFVPASLNIADPVGKKRMDIPRMLVIEDYKKDEKRLLEEEKEKDKHTSKKEKEEPPEYVPEEVMVTARAHDEKVVDTEEGEDAYTKQTREQVSSIRENFEICFAEAENFVNDKIAGYFEDKEHNTIEVRKVIIDVTLRIAQGFSITHQQNQRSGRY